MLIERISFPLSADDYEKGGYWKAWAWRRLQGGGVALTHKHVKTPTVSVDAGWKKAKRLPTFYPRFTFRKWV